MVRLTNHSIVMPRSPLLVDKKERVASSIYIGRKLTLSHSAQASRAASDIFGTMRVPTSAYEYPLTTDIFGCSLILVFRLPPRLKTTKVADLSAPLEMDLWTVPRPRLILARRFLTRLRAPTMLGSFCPINTDNLQYKKAARDDGRTVFGVSSCI